MLRVPQLLQNDWYKIPWERRMEWAEEPRRGGSWLCAVLRGPGADPSWLCMTSPTCDCTWPANHPALYSITEGRGCVPALGTHQLEVSPKEATQLLPSRLWCSPLSQRRQEELTAKAATGTRAEAALPGRREKHQHLGETSTSPHNYIKASALGKGESTALKNKKYLMKMNHDVLWQGRVTPEQLPQLSWAALRAW